MKILAVIIFIIIGMCIGVDLCYLFPSPSTHTKTEHWISIAQELSYAVLFCVLFDIVLNIKSNKK